MRCWCRSNSRVLRWCHCVTPSSRSRSPRRGGRDHDHDLSEADLDRIIRERNKQSAVAVGKDYAKRVARYAFHILSRLRVHFVEQLMINMKVICSFCSTKTALMLPATVGTARKRSKYVLLISLSLRIHACMHLGL